MTIHPQQPLYDSNDDQILQWRPLPFDVFPEPLCSYIRYSSMALGCDPTYVAIPFLTSLASAIGNTRRITLKENSWYAPCNAWGVVVAESGTLKTPAMEMALKPLIEAEDVVLKFHQDQIEEYKNKKLKYDAKIQNWKREGFKNHEPIPEEPKQPICTRYIVSDITIEALALILYDNPRGVLLYRDELAGWFGSFDTYKNSKGSDVPQWLELFNAGRLTVDRKTGNNKTIYVSRASVSITGTIQPKTLQYILTEKYFENGLAARVLMGMPPRIPKRWTEATIPIESQKEVKLVFKRLLALNFDHDQENFTPIDTPLSAEAKSMFIAYYNEVSQDQVSEEGPYSAALSKLEQYAARFALVFTLCRIAAKCEIPEHGVVVDPKSMKDGIRLARWFIHETKRIYNIFFENEEERSQRKLIEYIQGRGGSITPRQLYHSLRIYKGEGGADRAKLDLDALVDAGYAVKVEKKTTCPGPKVITYKLIGNLERPNQIDSSTQINSEAEAVNEELMNDPISKSSVEQPTNLEAFRPEDNINPHINNNQCKVSNNGQSEEDWGEI